MSEQKTNQVEKPKPIKSEDTLDQPCRKKMLAQDLIFRSFLFGHKCQHITAILCVFSYITV